LTRLLQKTAFLPDKSIDCLAEGKKVLPVACCLRLTKGFLPKATLSPSKSPTKVARARKRASPRYQSARPKPDGFLRPAAEETYYYDLLAMLPHLDIVNRDDETYVILGSVNSKVRVTEDDWNTLRFNPKTMNPEYFPSSYLSPDRFVGDRRRKHSEFSTFYHQRN
jgi:hypothetical protein